jgi:hypothetical protein
MVPQKLIVAQIVNTYSAFYETRRFITVFTGARCIQSASSHPTSCQLSRLQASRLQICINITSLQCVLDAHPSHELVYCLPWALWSRLHPHPRATLRSGNIATTNTTPSSLLAASHCDVRGPLTTVSYTDLRAQSYRNLTG